ncbi:glycosyltransferase family 9 protein [Pelagibacterales bacterium SAG-MED31]|nr:glycosyltransferase family 9 protein [Pelagibacterales bacterium SAG-MED31]
MKILFICSNLIGDTVLSTGVIKHFGVKYKNAKISLVIGPTAAPLFKNYQNIENVIIFKKKKFNLHWFDIFKKTYKTKWDIIVDFRSSILSYFLQNKNKYIFKKQKNLHHIEQLNSSFGFNCSNLFVPTSLDEENQVDKTLEDSFKYIVVFPGGNWIPKLWPLENFNKVMKSLLKKDYKIKFILVGSYKEKNKFYTQLVNGIDKKFIIDLFGFNLTLTSAFMKRSDLFIGNDSGLMHLAVSNQLKIISLFGPTDDKVYRPYGNENIVIRTKESLKYFKTINIDQNKSYMNSIKSDIVIRTLESSLK